MATETVNTNINIPQCEFLDPVTLRPSRPWLIWLQYPSVIGVNLANALNPQSGGTGLTSYVTGDLIYASGTETLTTLSKPSQKSFLVMDSSGVPSWQTSIPTAEGYVISSQGQSEFLVPFNYVMGENGLKVYVNGSKQINTLNYYETTTNTISFVTPLNKGDVVEFQG